MRRLAVLLVPLALLVACGGGPSDSSPPGGGPAGGPTDGDAGTCTGLEEGCACEPGTEPVDCYLEPEPTAEGVICHAGTRTCRDGRWSACESLREFTLPVDYSGLITDPPEICNVCNPDCYEAEDAPNDADLTADNSTGVIYDPGAGGLILEPVTVTTAGPDADGDGVPDVADDYPADPSRDGVTEEGGLFHILPYGGPSESDSLDFTTQVTTADVYFLMDATASMDDELANLQSDLTSGSFGCAASGGIIGAIECTIPDAWTGAGMFDDYPVEPYGNTAGCNDDGSFCWDDDTPYLNMADLSDDPTQTQSGVDAIALGAGGDQPESQTQALWAVATGNGLDGFTPARTDCPGAQWGYPCFRDNALPIVVLLTDASFHNGPYVTHDYDDNIFSTGQQSLPAATDLTGVEAADWGDVTGRWDSANGDTSVLGNDWDSWGCGTGSAGDFEYSFEVTDTRTITVTTQGSSFDTALALFEYDCGCAGHPSSCATGGVCVNDSAGIGSDSRLSMTLEPGCYWGIVDGDGGSEGDYRVTIGDPCEAGYCATFPPQWSEVLTALDEGSVRVITVESSGGFGDTQQSGVALANATGATDGSGSPYAFSIAADATGLSDSVVTAIEQVASSTRFDVSARPADDTSTGIDERSFVKSITVTGWGPGTCASSSGNTAADCSSGTVVDFNVEFQNDFVMPTATPQVFDFYIEVLLDGVVQERIPVRIVVPAEETTYPPAGSYTRTWDATDTCEIPPDRPKWGIFEWDASTPDDSSIRFEFRTAGTEAGLDAATPTSFTVPSDPDAGSRDVGALLRAAGISDVEPYLRMTARLLASSDASATPVLSTYRIQYHCFAAE